MAGENIRLQTTNQTNFAAYGGYFFVADYAQDNLLQKTDDGNTAFSYPFDILLSNPIKDLQFDGVYFWTLENPAGTSSIIKKWKIENYVCKQQQVISLVGDASHSYDVNTFSIEHYHTEFSSAAVSGSTTIYLDKYSDDSHAMGFATTSGVNLTLHLGPNNNGEEEDVILDSTVSGGITVTSPIQYTYDDGDGINFFTYLWIFNNYDGTSSATGALYKFDAYNGDYITRYASGAYKDVTAATFYNVDSFAAYGDVDTLCYIKGTNSLFVNTSGAGVSLPYYGSMVMNNISSDLFTLINPIAVTMDDQNVYRLQLRQDGTGSNWSTYNYQLSTLDSFVTSISMVAYPATIAANTIDTSTIIATVKDQFLQPISGRTVYFSEDDTVGSVSPATPSTNTDGVATTVYTSGNTARLVKITALVNQT